MLNSLAIDQREQFYEEHGKFVLTPDGPIIFEDGAQDENSVTGLGRLINPPEDKWERSKLICRYWQTVAEQREAAFHEFKAFLNGTGRSDVVLYTEQDKLNYLQLLKRRATAARTKYQNAKRRVKAHKPQWMIDDEAQDAEEAARKQEFLQDVDSIQL